ncbi:MAG: GNAT family N-acetyltransferase [Candidatus Pacearchaeota archaeon]
MQLKKFDKEFYESISDNKKLPLDTRATYYTVIVDNKKIGIIGFIPARFPAHAGFVQIILALEFRGKGLVKQAEDLLVKKYKIKTLFATIKKSNSASIKAHKKIGFEEISKEQINNLREKGFLKDDEIRLVKNY